MDLFSENGYGLVGELDACVGQSGNEQNLFPSFIFFLEIQLDMTEFCG
jgi:hypothetical protein